MAAGLLELFPEIIFFSEIMVTFSCIFVYDIFFFYKNEYIYIYAVKSRKLIFNICLVYVDVHVPEIMVTFGCTFVYDILFFYKKNNNLYFHVVNSRKLIIICLVYVRVPEIMVATFGCTFVYDILFL